MTQTEEAVFHNCSLFRGMEQQEREQLIRCLTAKEVHCEKGDIIFHMGQTVSACALILSGSVRAETVSASGAYSLMALHRTGALVGDVLMATPGQACPVYVTAAEKSTLIFLNYHRIMGGCSRCCRAHVQLRENLISEIARKFWVQRSRTGYLSVRSLRSRIAMYLLDQAGDSTTFSLGGTREDLADFLQVNRSALSRELSRMKAEGLLDFYKDTFRIPDADALRRAAQL